MKAIYIRNTHAVKYADAIVQGYKKCESRNRNMLKDLVGEEVAIIRTGRKEPEIVGYAFLSSSCKVDAAEFADRFNDHLVPAGSKYDCKPNGSKWLYYFSWAFPVDPIPVPANAVKHGRSWCEF